MNMYTSIHVYNVYPDMYVPFCPILSRWSGFQMPQFGVPDGPGRGPGRCGAADPGR